MKKNNQADSIPEKITKDDLINIVKETTLIPPAQKMIIRGLLYQIEDKQLEEIAGVCLSIGRDLASGEDESAKKKLAIIGLPESVSDMLIAKAKGMFAAL